MNNEKYISFRQLYEMDFDVTDLLVMRQKWKNGAVFHMSNPRKTTGLILLDNCKGVYINSNGQVIEAAKKSVVCLPYGSCYICQNVACTETFQDAILVEFNVVKEDKILTFSQSPFVLHDTNKTISTNLFQQAVKTYEASVRSPLAVKSTIFSLLAHIGKEQNEKQLDRFSVIRKGIEILESDPFLDIPIEEIARTCNVSPCYFRRLFKEYSSQSPHAYRLSIKLNMAKAMLENGDLTIDYISETLNFESPSYFGRLFKKHFGVPPGQYQKIVFEKSN